MKSKLFIWGRVMQTKTNELLCFVSGNAWKTFFWCTISQVLEFLVMLRQFLGSPGPNNHVSYSPHFGSILGILAS